METKNGAAGQAMEGTYDYRQYDRIWERVAPTLNPYPAARTQNSAAAARSKINGL